MCNRFKFQTYPSSTVSPAVLLAVSTAQLFRRLQSVTNELRQLKQAIESQSKVAFSDTRDRASASEQEISDSGFQDDNQSLLACQSLERSHSDLLNDDACFVDLEEAQLGDCILNRDDIKHLFKL